MKRWFKLSSWEAKGLMSLNLLIAFLILYRIGIGRFSTLDNDLIQRLDSIELFLIQKEQNLQNKITSLDTTQIVERKTLEKKKGSARKLKFQSFDPNRISATELFQYGISRKQAATFVNFRNALGVYTSVEEFEKLMGWDLEAKKALSQFAVFNDSPNNISKEAPIKTSPSKVLLNSADTSALKKLKGIGSVLAKRILAYRSLLGGYIQREQLFEVWGLDSACIQHNWKSFVIDTLYIEKMDINSVDLERLKRHPYITYKLAKAIISYRNQHGNYSAIEQIMNSVLIGREDYLKIAPYLTISKSGAKITSSD
ncbi:helix-hairpin-helix domain-containing protein [Luteibaculum oceani]|uniref:Helix-hairpin-helix domain-containing protein n=1 Tax=Luteibaculum oceani TaxID=1294296 RepID=A0A5C6V8E6_9FLAO|nr:helix-hairpin-helix domain-containing protein [Luteibaculum oceani]TXC81632.1 helix-hairpin-helix domain-containing protein [Luteibaculum oceani]